ncbi:MAG: 5'/3'-nucleotidase SurE [Bacillota bacterium]|jgi:5'-nucleotidase
MNKKLTILLGNDDGIEAAGIRILAKELGKFADVYISAPKNQKSAFSHNLSCNIPLYFGETEIEGAKKAWYVDDGTPADAMKIGLEVFLKDNPPDIVIAGINDGPNLGTDVYYSGTVAAGFEGHFMGIPSLAVSVNNWHGHDENHQKPYDFELTAEFVGKFIRWWANRNFQPKAYFNINTPADFNSIDKIAFTTIGVRLYNNVFVKFKDENNADYYKILGAPDDSQTVKNSDVDYINQGYITISPIGNDMTDYKILQEISIINTDDITNF